MDVRITVPYGAGEVSCSVRKGRAVNVVRAAAPEPGPSVSEAEVAGRALASPIGSARLSELARGARKIVILTSDHTRPVPSHITIPPMLDEIRAGSPDADITIIIGVGSHRATTREEMARKFGEGLVRRERIENHDPADGSRLTSLGRLPSGGELLINKTA
ncbi:MAG: lactate racemase domain-containing protein, partial [Synergistaceae bacterium]|nr:lactate racemase domain-containing protein [Synergistaceae bacterium]